MPFGPAAWKLVCARLLVGGIAETVRLLGVLEKFLAEQRQFLPRMGIVESNDVGERAHRDRRRAALQIFGRDRP